ncbi:hypothetical protein [Erythrobacter donghaensis]|uniref:hypothetical protein n=1 Tax=Erythrobacter donghaensis TaxID=267135 RepID=UPI001FE5F90D|nr:hypothetical protein [Erythrobacter donghaensis]
MAISDDILAVEAAERRGFAARWAGLREAARSRKLTSLAIALALEALILLLLLTLGTQFAGEPDEKVVITEFAASTVTPSAEPETETEPEQQAESPDSAPQPTPDQALPQPEQPFASPFDTNPRPAPSPTPQPEARPDPKPSASPSPKIGAKVRQGQSYGPADTGDPRRAGDSQQVGTAPNGEPLYAARWYREPTDQELAGYLSTASGPGYALIACKTVTGYYVEDCQLLSEAPQGAQIGRAVMAAAWQFRVRPARIGGREQFGSWVRIRIDYSVRQRPR